MARRLASLEGPNGPSGLGRQAVDLLGGEDTALPEDLLLVGAETLAHGGLVPCVRLALAGAKLLDLLGDPHAAPVMAAHRAEIRVHVQIFVVQCPGRIRIEAQCKVLLPVQRSAGARQLIVPVARGGDPQGDIGGMRGDLVGDAPLFDVILLRQSQVLLWRHIAEQGRAVVGRRRRPDTGGDVVVAGEDVRHQRAKHIKGRAMTDPPLDLGVVLDLVKGNMAGPLHHHLNPVGPRPLGQLADRLQLGQLGVVAGIGEPAGPEPVTDGERDVVFPHDPADLVPQLVHRILPVLDEHPLGQQRAPTGDDADEPALDILQMLAKDPGVNREVVDALLGLLADLGQDDLGREVPKPAADDHRVDGDGADRNA